MSTVNRILVDSRFRQPDSISITDFRIELPENVHLDEGVSCVVCDISLPVTWYTVEVNVNDKLYIRMYQADGTTYSDHIVKLPSRNYTREEVASRLTTLFDELDDVPLTVGEDPFRNIIRIFLPEDSNRSFMVFTNQDLLNRCNGTWKGEFYIQSNPQSINQMIGNSDKHMQVYSASNIFEGGQFNILPHATLYIVSPELTTSSNIGPQGERDILKKVLVTAGPNSLMFDKDINTDDHVDVSKRSLRSIHFRLTDVYGNTLNLHGQHWSFTLLFRHF